MRLAAVHHARFGADPDNPRLPELVTFWAERLAASGAATEPERYFSGNRNPLTEMCLHHVNRAPRPPRLLIAAHATADSDPYSSLAGRFARHRPDHDALVFAVSDQGRVAPFSALLAAGGYPRRRPGLVVALDQAAIPYADPELAELDPVTDHAIGLLLTDDGPVRIHRLRQLPGVPADQVAEVLAAELPPLAPDLVITGRHVPAPDRWPVRPAPADQLCTAVWSVLASVLAGPAAQRRVAVVEYEPLLPTLCVAAFDLPAVDSGGPADRLAAGKEGAG